MKKDRKWFEEGAGIFGKEYLHEYADILTPERTTAEVDYIVRELITKDTDCILDVPCGHGRHALELARRKYQVTGVDLSQEFISQALRTAGAEKLDNLTLLHGDMRMLHQFNLAGQFDVAINMFTAMGYFESENDDRSFLAGVYRALKPNGYLVIDYLNRDWLMRNYQQVAVRTLADGARSLIERRYDPVKGINVDRRSRISGDRIVSVVETTLRLYTVNELIALAKSVGFIFDEVKGGFAGEAFTMDSPRMVATFVK